MRDDGRVHFFSASSSCTCAGQDDALSEPHRKVQGAGRRAARRLIQRSTCGTFFALLILTVPPRALIASCSTFTAVLSDAASA